MDSEYERYRADQSRRYLREMRGMRRRVLALRLQVQDMREVAAGLRGIDYTRPHVESSPRDSMPDAVARPVALTEGVEQEIAEYTGALDACGAALDALGGWQADLLRAHYLGNVPLVELGQMPEWAHGRQYMSRLHRRALSDFYDFIPRRGKDPLPPAV